MFGQKGKEAEVLNYPRASRAKQSGFTLIEVLITVFIAVVIIAGLFTSLSAGQVSFPLSAVKVDLQSRVRLIEEWMVKDARQTVSWDIANNSPSPNHIKFRRVSGVNITTGDYVLGNNYTEYNYDDSAAKITRNIIDSGGSTVKTWEFTDIVDSPFYTVDFTDTIVPLNEDDLRNSGTLIITIKGQRNVRGSLNVGYNLSTEVKIRNE